VTTQKVGNQHTALFFGMALTNPSDSHCGVETAGIRRGALLKRLLLISIHRFIHSTEKLDC
jgi:hypothetical protein